MWLVDDEVVGLEVRDRMESFRMRIWRARRQPALVLISREPGGETSSPRDLRKWDVKLGGSTPVGIISKIHLTLDTCVLWG
jgi:hypothetical protein